MPAYPYTVKSFMSVNIALETLVWQPTAGSVISLYGYSLSLSRGLGPIVFKDGWGGKVILTITPKGLSEAIVEKAPEDGVPKNAIASTSTNTPLVMTGAPGSLLSGFICGAEELGWKGV